MRPVRAVSARRRTSGALRRVRWTAPALTVAVVGSLVLGHPGPGGAGPAEGPGTGAGAGVGSTGTAAVETVATTRVELKRTKGTVTGDGQTVYVANRTEFRPRRTTVALPPRVRARSWAVVDLDTGRIIGRNDARRKLPQASTIKLLTALTATRTIRPGTRHRVTRWEASRTCSCAGVKRGGVYARDTLLRGMLLPSGNDAAEAVAGSHPRGRKAFYRAMNRLARKLGASDTAARNASGLTAAGSHSSSRDLVILLRAALTDPTVSGILAERSAEIATVAGRHRRTVWRSTDYVNRYEGSLGKSGWTTPAQNTLVVVTDVRGRRIAVATMGAPSGYSTSGARRLTRWAGANVHGLRAVGRLPRP
jgi:serine-type D-Ala-D-Ala carboxypeptidase (penicillin-binding protein 5/6)